MNNVVIMVSMSHVEWRDEYNLGVSIIDTQHQQFLQLMEQAYDAFYKRETKDELAVLMGNLKDYTLLHFGTEEKYFDLFNYEFKEEHVRHHMQLKEQLIGLMKDFEVKGPDMIPNLIDFLENWLVNHLNHEDKKYVQCFKENGL